MTTDFLVDVIRDGRLSQMARAVKLAAELDKPRVLEKLKIEQRYWLEQGVDWGIVTEKDNPAVAVRNIAWIHNYGSISHLSQPYPGYFEEMTAHVLRELLAQPSLSLRQFCMDMDQRFSMASGTALMLVRHLLARKTLKFPLNEPLDEGLPVASFSVPGLERLKTPG